MKKLTACTLAMALLAACAAAIAQPAVEAPKGAGGLIEAAKDGNVKAIKQALASGVKVDAKNQYGVTALFVGVAVTARAMASKYSSDCSLS